MWWPYPSAPTGRVIRVRWLRMAYSLQIGLRYLRSKKRSSLSVITVVAVAGVALGVGALLAVLSITSGFQDEFRNKVLGVNAHVLVLKYGLDFEEYRDVIATADAMPSVAASAPFVINEMMIAKGDSISGVLVKGIDPESSPEVLDLPHQIVAGSLTGLRLPGAEPAVRPGDRLFEGTDDDLDLMLQRLRDLDGARGEEGGPDPLEGMSQAQIDTLIDRAARGEPLVEGAPDSAPPDADVPPATD